MIPTLTLAAVLAAAVPAISMAQPATQGVISYPPAYFAEQRPSTALDMVQRLPGFSIDGGDDVRGFEGAAGNVLIDGARPTSKTDDIEEILRRIPAAQVAHVELIRGGAPGIDMQGKSILANVVKVKGAGFQGLIALANNHIIDDGRNSSGVRLEASGQAGPGAWEAGLRYGQGIDDGSGPGPRVRLAANGAPLIRSQIDSHGRAYQWVVTGAYETPLAGGKLKLNTRGYWNWYEFNQLDWIAFPAPALESRNYSEDEYETELGARYERPLGGRMDLELVGLQKLTGADIVSLSRATGSNGDFFLDQKTSESIGRGVLKYRQSERLSFEAGAEAALNILESETDQLSNGVPDKLPAADVKVTETRGEVFGKSVWKPLPTLTLEGGLRYEGSVLTSEGDVSLEKTLYFLKPRLAGSWAPSDTTQVRFRYERVVGQLDFDDFVADSSPNGGGLAVGNPALTPEQAWVSELAFEQRFWTKGALVLTLRHSKLTDVIDRAPIFSGALVFDAPSNIGDGTKDELILNATLPLDRVLKGAQLRGQSTWRRSEVTDPTTLEKREISRLRPLEWEAHFTHDLPQWRMNWGFDVFSAWRETSYKYNAIYTDKLKTWMVLFAEWKPRPDLNVRAELNNVTERGFRHTTTAYAGPRSTSAVKHVDDRDIQFGRGLFIRVRKTF
ncbi:TonB-dependent receptor domain-containing protein [Phenylobacterium sp.]|uniref:TonB-dependent receptor plug domain-containing protein n=1 Tax=Phenylobacterium sp. TaxID=1871053 RepID=UPI00286DE77C|nr:TonB-dependent receptor [Phenylobacterium sp.]